MDGHPHSLLFLILIVLGVLCHEATCELLVEAFSSGADCNCRCQVSAKEGKVCSDGISYETIYQVDAIPSGSNCSCSCKTPPPSPCQDDSVFEVDDEFSQIDIKDLHHSVAKLVKTLAKLDKVLLRSKPKSKTKGKATKITDTESVSNVQNSLNPHTSNPEPMDTERSEIKLRENSSDPVVPQMRDVDDESLFDIPPATKMLITREVQFNSTFASEVREESLKSSTTDSQNLTELSTIIEQTTAASSLNQDISIVPHTTSKTVPEIWQPFKSRTSSTTQTSLSSSITTTSTTTSTTVDDLSSESRRKIDLYRSKINSGNREFPDSDSDENNFSYEYDEYGKLVTSTNASSATITTTATSRQKSSTTSIPESKTENDDYYDYDDDYYEEYVTSTTTTTSPTTATERGQDPCGTLNGLSHPRIISHFGRKQGAWLRDSVNIGTDSNGNAKVYVTNFYFGNRLLEFENIESMRILNFGNAYILPHKWIGTGHIVYNGSFYYNRAFSTSLIKYELQRRSVTAWRRLANALYRTGVSRSWSGQSFVHFLADELGLWVIYPSRDPRDPYSKLTYIVNRINPEGLEVLESYKTKLRQSPSHFFMICGILYSTKGYNSKKARVMNAFDTRTMARRTLYLEVENLFSYNVQFSYNPTDRKIYSWDNGRQVQYDVKLVH